MSFSKKNGSRAIGETHGVNGKNKPKLFLHITHKT